MYVNHLMVCEPGFELEIQSACPKFSFKHFDPSRACIKGTSKGCNTSRKSNKT